MRRSIILFGLILLMSNCFAQNIVALYKQAESADRKLNGIDFSPNF